MQGTAKKRTIFFSAPIQVLVAVTVSLFLVSATATAQTETVLYNFTGGADGGYPSSTLALDDQGNVYGTTPFRGSSLPQCPSGCGVVFEVSPAGTETVLYTFSWGDGAVPNGLLRDARGNLYGSTQVGGGAGAGAIWKLAPNGTEKVLYSFGGANGTQPRAGLAHDSKGNLYGTTQQGGYFGGSCSNGGCGTVFKISPATGTETVLYSFTGAPDAFYPTAGLTLDSQGNLYGTTLNGGAYGYGAVFKVTPAGTETVLYSFTGLADGAYPASALIVDNQGNLYGTTEEGGASGFGSLGYGTVFKVVP